MPRFKNTIVIIVIIVLCTFLIFSSKSWSGGYSAWHEVGPGGGGAVQDFAFDPYDSNRVYLTSDMVGVFVSDDAGDHWRWSSYGAPNQKGGIAVDPSNPNILYVVGREGIYMSTDRAGHWQLIYSKGNGFQGINNVHFPGLENSVFGAPGQSISISSSGIVYVHTVTGDIIISNDRGKSWKCVSTGGRSSVISIIPIDNKNVVAALYRDGIYLSRDEGISWEKTLSSDNGDILALAIHPIKRNVLYALIGRLSNPYSQNRLPAYLFQSTDAGVTWKLAHSFQELDLREGGRRLIDVSSKGTIIILTAKGSIRSTDDGRNWESSNIKGKKDDGFIYDALKGNPDGPHTIYADFRKADTWYMTNMLAAFRSDDDGKTWHYKVEGLREQAYWFARVNPANPDIVIASDLDHGLIRSSDNGNTWHNVIIVNPYEECNQLRFLPEDGTYNVLYALYNHPYPFIAKSADAGKTWSVLKKWENKGYWAMNGMSLTKGDNFPVIYVGEPNIGIWKSIDEGQNWTRTNKGLPRSEEISYIQFLESDKRGYIYAGIASNVKGKGGVYTSRDGGETWFQINKGVESLWPRRGGFEIDPNNPDILWLGAGRAVYKSEDAGMTWEKRIEGVYCSAILVEPGNSDIVYIASYTGGSITEQFTEGIFKSVDGGNYFFKISGDLFRTIGTTYRIQDLEYGWRGQGGIWAAPNGGGLIYTIPPHIQHE